MQTLARKMVTASCLKSIFVDEDTAAAGDIRVWKLAAASTAALVIMLPAPMPIVAMTTSTTWDSEKPPNTGTIPAMPETMRMGIQTSETRLPSASPVWAVSATALPMP